MNRVVILHNIRSAHNVGSIFRTADGAGVSKIYLTGYTPTPLDRFNRVNGEIAKTSLGATETVAWEQYEEISHCLQKLKADGFKIVAVEQHSRSVSYRSFTEEGNVAFIFGNEIEGVPPDICEAADVVVMIPMQGEKESLNVSVCAGIILFNTQ